MKKTSKSKILFTLSLIFFFTSIASKINNTYTMNKRYKNRDIQMKSINTINKDEEKKIKELINTMDEAMELLNSDNMSHEVRKQLIRDMIDGATSINNKLNLKDYAFVDELNTQYHNLEEGKSIILSRLKKRYNKWKLKISQL